MATLPISEEFVSNIAAIVSVSATGGGAFVWDSVAGLSGATGGIKITAVNGAVARGLINWTAIGGSPTLFYADGMIDPNSLTMASGDVFDTFLIWDGNDGGRVAVVHLKKVTSQYYLRIEAFHDNGTSAGATDVAITDAPHWFGVRVTKGSGTSGKVDFYVDTTASIAATISSVDNDSNFALINRVTFGYTTGTVDSGTSGNYYMDRMQANSSGTLSGPPNVSPTVTNISNQTGTMGTQKSVACTIADADSNLTRCDVSTDGACLITLTASGSAVVTNNGTTATYVTGTHADVVATLGNNIKLDRAFTWTDETQAPVWTVAETITVLVTDDLDATGNDTFTMTWTIATGDGTLSLNLDNATIAGMSAETALAYLIPETDFTGTTYLYALLTDDNGNTNAVIIEVIISEPSNPIIQISPLSIKSSDSFSQVFTITLLSNVLTDVSDETSIGAAITLGGLFAGLNYDQIIKINSKQFSIRVYGNLATTLNFGTINLNESELV